MLCFLIIADSKTLLCLIMYLFGRKKEIDIRRLPVSWDMGSFPPLRFQHFIRKRKFILIHVYKYVYGFPMKETDISVHFIV